ncbi:hypothetical protein THAOC_13180 [Thalassiosira oceanica]|uniref:Uncharacterized protein n=1 Tax=Thalassiosira oceanica TaxID=159749 RepID=K0SLQ3_THAOC|nr:hypothetical protein THAOC_13180 [Thalassiosira oceanica]|eukprot:EJK65919.1 hypothetical protein THAOC_13180 [Thalassiosira oceanica]
MYYVHTRKPRSPRTGDGAGRMDRTGGGAIRARLRDRPDEPRATRRAERRAPEEARRQAAAGTRGFNPKLGGSHILEGKRVNVTLTSFYTVTADLGGRVALVDAPSERGTPSQLTSAFTSRKKDASRCHDP